MKKYIGIDPGKNGGIAVMDEDGKIKFLRKMPATPQDLFDILKIEKEAVQLPNGLQKAHNDIICILEKVGGRPGNAGSAMFNFGKGYGHIEMALIALGIPTETVTPQKWEKEYQLGSSSSCSTVEWKNRLKAKAQQLFPTWGGLITLATCDALLLAEWGRRKFKIVAYSDRH